MGLLHQGRLASKFGEYINARANAFKDWPTNEDHFQWVFFQGGGSADNIAVNLPAVPVAQHGHVQQAQRLLMWIFDFGGEQNRASARAENSFVFGGEFPDGLVQAFFLQELELGGAF